MDKHVNHFEIRWENFKSFKDSKWVKIKPITILLGENNSGKSNLIAPFLLLQQTLNSKDPKSPLIIKSELYDGGNIKELTTNYDLKKDIKFSIRYHMHDTDEKKLPPLGVHAPGSFEVVFGVKGHLKDGEIFVKKETIADVYNREFITLQYTADDKYKISGPYSQRQMSSNEKKSIRISSPINFIFNPDSFLRELAELRRPNKEKTNTSRKSRYSNAFSDILEVLSFNYSFIYSYLGYLSYIGPIREFPRRVYEVSNENFNTVGQKGENMTNLIKKHFSKRSKELDYWIRKFGFGDWLELEKLYGNSYSIRFRENKSPYFTCIANTGFGTSQILPLIIQALVADEGDLTIAEQPELHLNPKLQCELADLFVFMAQKNQKIIVETHSEYLLLRLRKLIAEKKIVSDDVAIYFIKKVNGLSSISEIPIQEDGHIKKEDWPGDFFEDSLRESLALASEQFKYNTVATQSK